MKKAIFTIAAKNYLAQAKTLGYSVKKFCPDVDFFILMSDEIDGQDIGCNNFTVIEAKDIEISEYYSMAFKYNVIEFSTSIKPFFITRLFDLGYDKVLYLDPDMVVYHSLDYLYEQLDNHDALLTPHILKPYVKYKGATSEEELLFVGIYNLGFFGVKNSHTGRQIAKWWEEKLTYQCYADKEDALHVDQRWMDFLPSLYGDNISILRHPGVNTAFWNIHEREFVERDGDYYVDSEHLLIFHFSGFEVDNCFNMCRKQTKFNLGNKPEYKNLFENYLKQLNNCEVKRHQYMQYTYSAYKNGVNIVPYQRRLYRGLLKKGYSFEGNPFDTDKKSTYYQLLKENSLLIEDSNGKYVKLQKTYPNYKALFEKANKVLRFFKSIIGIKRYYMLNRYLAAHIRFEEQTFLIKENEKNRN